MISAAKHEGDDDLAGDGGGAENQAEQVRQQDEHEDREDEGEEAHPSLPAVSRTVERRIRRPFRPRLHAVGTMAADVPSTISATAASETITIQSEALVKDASSEPSRKSRIRLMLNWWIGSIAGPAAATIAPFSVAAGSRLLFPEPDVGFAAIR